MDNRYGENGSNKFTAYAGLAIALAVALFLIMVFISNRIADEPAQPAVMDGQPRLATTTDEVSAPATDIEQPDEQPDEDVNLGGQEPAPVMPEETPIQHGR